MSSPSFPRVWARVYSPGGFTARLGAATSNAAVGGPVQTSTMYPLRYWMTRSAATKSVYSNT